MGRYRDLTDAEIKELNELIEPSSKTEEASLPRTETPKGEQNSSKGRSQVQEKGDY
jgi:23S rRNA pseudouridine2604 synthase